MSPTPVIVWFRQDLRLADNPALAAAADTGAPVIPVYILDQGADARSLGGAGRWWLNRSLAALEASLAARGSGLVLRSGQAGAVLRALVEETGASAVHWNRLYDPGSVKRDSQIKAQLTELGVEARSYNAALLNEPWTIATGQGGPFKVFTPYWRAARSQFGAAHVRPAPSRFSPPPAWPASEALASWRLHPRAPDWSTGFSEWSPGEAGATARLDAFLDDGLAGYAVGRDHPDIDPGSRLSPHLHWGEVGPRQIWARAEAMAHVDGRSQGDLDKFLAELGWREFNHHLLFHFPRIASGNFREAFDAFPWREDSAGLAAWRRGRTGYPMVDAGMRELWTTGFMHNRVRMITASFLVKDLLVDWRAGEAWFWDTLVDADIANNAANWQWVAGSGADAAPYFRIFNPVAQGERFDGEGAYVRRWVPELARLPAEWIHRPWEAPAAVLAEARVSLGTSYPLPIVDRRVSRPRALAAYASVRGAPAIDDGPG
jgi:deoxyribodipyrimidine photo-lyase